MKKFLLSVVGVASILTTSATNSDLVEKWTKTKDGLISIEDVSYNIPVAVTSDGNIYVAREFTESFEFAGEELMPVATSSYILKYAVDGSEVWGVAIAGSATVVDTDIDDSGNLYVVGTFADEVNFGSTDGNAIAKEGQKASDGSYYAKQNSSFIAKYDATGVLQGVETFVPTYHPSLASMVDISYYPMDGDVTFHINKVDVVGDKVYCSATYTGETAKDSATFLGSVYDMEGWGFYFMDIEAGAVFDINTDLSDCNIVASVNLTQTPDPVAGYGVLSSSFAVSGENIYAAFTCANDVTLTIGDETKDYSYAKIDADNYVEYGYLVAAIDKATGASVATESYTTKSAATVPIEFVSDMHVYGNIAVLVGTFQNTLPFDADITATGNNDLFVVGLDSSNLSSKWNAVSGASEGDNNKEVTISTDIWHNYLWVNATIEDYDGNIVDNIIDSVLLELSDAASFAQSRLICNNVSVNGKYIALTAEAGINTSIVAVGLFEDPEGAIDDIEVDADLAHPVKYYNLQGIEVSKENISSGLYISKQGNKTTKILIK